MIFLIILMESCLLNINFFIFSPLSQILSKFWKKFFKQFLWVARLKKKYKFWNTWFCYFLSTINNWQIYQLSSSFLYNVTISEFLANTKKLISPRCWYFTNERAYIFLHIILITYVRTDRYNVRRWKMRSFKINR